MAIKTPYTTTGKPGVRRVTLSPQLYEAVIFDMDGVVTQTATVHATAWKKLFDEFLTQYAEQHHQPFKPFDIEFDYLKYVDGKKREDGLISFLDSRGLHIPMGNPDDSPDQQTVYGMSQRKDEFFLEQLYQNGVQAYDSTISLIKRLREKHIRTAIISASRHCEEVLRAAQVLDLFDTRVDGIVAEQLHLPGKPNPDVFLEAARRLDVLPSKAVVIEDAISGVEAGHAGKFGLVIGINRHHLAADLKTHGADVVVEDLIQVSLSQSEDSCVHHSNIQAPAPDMNDWALIYDRYVSAEEGRRETLCALGNGYFVTRAAAIESHDDGIHYPGTYLAGGYNRLTSDIKGNLVESEDLVNFPNWLVLKFKINDGDWFSLDTTEILSFRQTLNLKEGVLYRSVRFCDTQGQETELLEQRLVHMQDAHYAALKLTLTPLNWSGSLTLYSALDGTVINNNIKEPNFLKRKHLETVESRQLSPDSIYLKIQTNQSHIEMAQAARTLILYDGEPKACDRKLVDKPEGYIGQECTLAVSSGHVIQIEKIVALYTSRDNAISECGLEACKAITRISDFKTLFDSHVEAWKHLWERFDISISTRTLETERRISLVLRLHIFHFLQTLSANSMDLDIGVPARGWHGEGYQGHIFWDNVLVFRFLNLHLPSLTASLLKYRYHRLPEARYMATQAGYRGAMFPWQSGSDGREETPMSYLFAGTDRWVADESHLQRHVNADIAYNIWQHFQMTGNLDFLFSYGAEVILEAARFWASMTHYNDTVERYEICGIVGPDEYHTRYPWNNTEPGLKNNTYTNVMAVWVLCKAQETLNMLPEDHRKALRDKLDLTDKELHHWSDISRKMRIVFQDDQILSQFEGFETLAELDWNTYHLEHNNLQHIDVFLAQAEDTPNRYKILKQADVLMLFYLFSYNELHQLFERLGYLFPKEAIPKNIEYYTKRTAHGSTLSRVVHAWVLSRQDRTRSFDLLVEALESDLSDTQGGTTPAGIHLGAMAGTVDIVQRCYTGIVVNDDILWFNPCLPDQFTCIAFTMHYRHQGLKIELNQEKLLITALSCEAHGIRVGFEEKIYTLNPGQKLQFNLEQKTVS